MKCFLKLLLTPTLGVIIGSVMLIVFSSIIISKVISSLNKSYIAYNPENDREIDVQRITKHT